MLTTPFPVRAYSASYVFRETCISWTESTPGVPNVEPQSPPLLLRPSTWIVLLPSRPPFMEKRPQFWSRTLSRILSRPLLAKLEKTPALVWTRASGFRKLRGSSVISLRSSEAVWLADCVSSMTASAVTSTVSVTSPSSS